MKYNIDGLIISNNQGVRNAVFNLFNAIDSHLLWLGEYYLVEIDGDDLLFPSGFKAVKFHICFNDENERDNTLASLHGLQGIFTNCEDGSYYNKVLSDHDLSKNERTKSIVIDRWSK